MGWRGGRCGLVTFRHHGIVNMFSGEDEGKDYLWTRTL